MTDSMRRLSDGLSRLVREHLALARIELAGEAKRALRDALFAGAGIPAIVLGYLFMMAAIALAIGSAIGMAWGFAIVGGVHLVAGIAVSAVFARLLAHRDAVKMKRTSNELREDGRWLKQLRRS